MIKPHSLKPGDKIATVSLSRGGPGTIPERYLAGKKQLEEEFGVIVVEMEHTMKDAQWIYDHPKERAEDLMNAFKDPSIKGIISTIGGEESIRLLPYIDFDIIRDNPKVFLGYSDTTISHFFCYKAGIVSFYGPSIMAGFGENGGMFHYMVESVRKTIFSSDIIGKIEANTEGWTNEFLDWGNLEYQNKKRKLLPSEPWRWLQGKGIVTGELIGGCIDVLPFMIGTSIRPSLDEWKGKILFLEASEEKISETYFERIIRNLGSQGILQLLSGIIFGRAQMDYATDKQLDYDTVILKVIVGELGLTTLPIVTNMDFGHSDPMIVLPLGVKASIDCDTKIFSITENACIDTIK